MARTSQRAPLTADRVLQAALALVDRDGVDELSMRKLAKELGFEVMSLYNHVANKDEVLAAAIRAGCHDSVTTNDRADAWWLRAIGLHLHGEPVVPETAYRDKALAKLREAER